MRGQDNGKTAGTAGFILIAIVILTQANARNQNSKRPPGKARRGTPGSDQNIAGNEMERRGSDTVMRIASSPSRALARRRAPCYTTCMKFRIWIVSLWIACIAQAGTLYQVSTLQALMEGRYDGVITVGELKQHGDFGLGTFHAVEGEMVMVHGTVYQALADGTVQVADDALGVPFAAVADINMEDGSARRFALPSLVLDALHDYISRAFPDEHVPLAIYATGTFSRVQVRSVAAQEPPYPPLPDVIAQQVLFERDDVDGELVGFRLPEFWNGVNAPGYHFHFISSDQTFGGHVLDMTVDNGWLFIQALRNAFLHLGEP